MSDVDEIVSKLKSQRQAAIDAVGRANMMDDIDGRIDVYDAIKPVDVEEHTYTVELEVTDFELASLTAKLMEPLSKPSAADEVVVATSVLMQLLEGAPEHVDRMSSFGDDSNTEIRGYQ